MRTPTKLTNAISKTQLLGQKKGHIRGIFGKNPPFFGPKSCVFEIALVRLVGVRTYENILRPTQNPTLAGMDPLALIIEPLDKRSYFPIRRLLVAWCFNHGITARKGRFEIIVSALYVMTTHVMTAQICGFRVIF